MSGEGRSGDGVRPGNLAEQQRDEHQTGQIDGDVVEDHEQGVAHGADEGLPGHYGSVGQQLSDQERYQQGQGDPAEPAPELAECEVGLDKYRPLSEWVQYNRVVRN